MKGTYLIRYLRDGHAQIQTSLFDEEAEALAFTDTLEGKCHWYRLYGCHMMSGVER